MGRHAVTADDLPLLDEPLPVELANTWYVGPGGEVTDFLETPALVRLWFEAAPVAAGLVVPADLDPAGAATVRGVRDAVRALLDARVTGGAPPSSALDALNLAAGPSRPVLGYTPGVGFRAGSVVVGAPLEVLCTRLAGAAIDFVVGSSVTRLRRCTGPGCTMLYVQDHHRRRWCHESCGHRSRQARYYRRKTSLPTGELP